MNAHIEITQDLKETITNNEEKIKIPNTETFPIYFRYGIIDLRSTALT